jgi:HK97 family phage major capsid protein
MTNIQQTVQDMEITVKEIETMVKKQIDKQDDYKKAYHAALHRPVMNTNDFVHEQEKMGLKNFIQTGLQKKSLTSADQSGGFSIPSALVHQYGNKKIGHVSSIRFLSSIAEISTDQLDLLKEKGKAQVGWALETEERRETGTAEFEKQLIPVHEIYAKPKISQKLLDDSAINLDEWVENKICAAMAVQENEAFLKGNGIGKPRGILNYLDDGLEIFKTGLKGEIKNADILLKTVYGLSSDLLSGACWVMSRSALAAVRMLKDTQSGRYLLQPAIDGGFGNVLFGFPIYINDALDIVESGVVCTPILFGNFKKGYQVVDRKDMTILRDPYSSKPFVEFYAVKRVGGDLVDKSAIKAIQFTD